MNDYSVDIDNDGKALTFDDFIEQIMPLFIIEPGKPPSPRFYPTIYSHLDKVKYKAEDEDFRVSYTDQGDYIVNYLKRPGSGQGKSLETAVRSLVDKFGMYWLRQFKFS